MGGYLKPALLYIAIGGFALGVLWRSFFDFGVALPAFLLALAAGLAALFLLRRTRAVLFVALFLIAAALGVLRFTAAESAPHPALLSRAGTEISAEGTIAAEPDERLSNTHLTIALETLAEERFTGDARPKVLAYANVHPRFAYGERVRITGELARPEAFETETGRVFDYRRYLEKDGIHFVIFRPELAKLGEGEGSAVRRALFALKGAFLDKIQLLIPDPESSLLGGLLLGTKQALGEELEERFRETGIIHIVVLSGYNVSIVADAIMRFLSFLPQLAGIGVGALAIVFFAIMTGASATVVRASAMAILVLVARATGRTYAIMHALLLAGFGMVLHNPYVLAFDPSFQLSFTATFGLIALAPKLEERLRLVPSRWQLREVATATIATQLFVLPLLLYMTGEFSLVALPVNLLVLIAIPATMFLGFITGLVGFASALLAVPLAYATHLLLAYELGVVELFARLPFASVALPSFPVWLALGVYALYGAALWRLYRRSG